MNKLHVLTAIGLGVLLSACAAPSRNLAALDAKIDEATQGDFGQFIAHESLAEENLAHARKIKQYWQDDHYWNIELEKCALDAAGKAAEHRKLAEEALIRWHDNCDRHKEICHRLDELGGLHKENLLPVAYFDTGSAVPKSLRQEHIDSVLHLAKDYPNLTVDVIAYTDTVGKAHANKHLAERRADAVRALLVKQGLPASAIVHDVAVGEAPGPDNRPSAENRRVDLQVHQPTEGHHGHRTHYEHGRHGQH
ncbi:OmpA family protein [Methylococcus sp. EFPC2]|uniref:OmpA family protein n=1 Tax=Methylococcus sp. EFPC2 TaxID=2812648 RepID=UPI0019687D67|nr:OmpA family protein [Methylococcus sp. EFPC2]QSA95583.1 OmpA family protein [Methylococcus sp. EFPC2]